MVLTEKVREGMSRILMEGLLQPDGALPAVALAPEVEGMLAEGLPGGRGLDPHATREVLQRVVKAATVLGHRGIQPVVVVAQRIRPLVRSLMDRVLPAATVLSFEEIPAEVTLETVALVSLDEHPRAVA